MKLLFTLVISTTILISCLTAKNQGFTTPHQGIKGYVTENQGNRMPMKQIEQKVSKGLQCRILIFESTSINDTKPNYISNLYEIIRTKQVGFVETDSTGQFSVELPEGKYSLFIKQGDKFYANIFNQYNQIALFEVLPNQFTEAHLTLNRGATY